jgi:hypothetical protein
MRDLLSQVRKMKPATTPSRPDKIDRARKLTELIVVHQEHKITPDVFERYAEDFLKSRKRSKALTADPVPPGEVGPNGYPVGYTKEGDKVEWLPDEENPDEVWPMILRRNDNAILEAEQEFFDVIWYDRKLVLLQNIKEGTETNTPEIHKAMLAAMRRVEKKYGKRKLRNMPREPPPRCTSGQHRSRKSAVWLQGCLRRAPRDQPRALLLIGNLIGELLALVQFQVRTVSQGSSCSCIAMVRPSNDSS